MILEIFEMKKKAVQELSSSNTIIVMYLETTSEVLQGQE